MSATNRGTERNAYDLYETPDYAIDSLASVLKPELRREFTDDELPIIEFFEPTAGSGKIIRRLQDTLGVEGFWWANEIDEQHEKSLTELIPGEQLTIGDIRDYDVESGFDYIIGNPPYSMAQEVIEKCIPLLDGYGTLIFLLRLNFLGSQKRKSFFQEHPVKRITVLSKRPSFTGHGTDATEYAWFWWGKNVAPKIEVV